MPIARDPRNDRRRRILRESAIETASTKTRSKRKSTNANPSAESATGRKSAGYSQDVRRSCGHRLVQLIPVRRRSYAAVLLISLLVPALLSLGHYLVYVNGKLPWYGHPLALLLDASYSRSLAAWFTDKLWMLCLGATILTFQLRRHKLDDYSGEYRLWFWLVLTCVLGSLEASTGIVGLFGAALNHWSLASLGWSGPAVVKATTAVLVGMLGLRLCTELKSSPASIVLVLTGLVAWGGSTALAQPELNIKWSPQVRIWAQASLWLTGLTCIWAASLSYLRVVYIDAQQRFLSRNGVLAAANTTPLRERMRSAMPRFRRGEASEQGAQSDSDQTRRGWAMPQMRWPKRRGNPPGTNAQDIPADIPADSGSNTNPRSRSDETDGSNRKRSRTAAEAPTRAEPNRPSREDHPHDDFGENKTDSPRRGLGGFLRRKKTDDSLGQDEAPIQPNAARDNDDLEGGSRWTSWLRRPKHNDEAPEFRKVSSEDEEMARADKQSRRAEKKSQREAARRESGEENGDGDTPRRSWASRIPKPSMPRIPKPNISGWTSKLRMPKIKLPKMPSLRLLPPQDDQDDEPVAERPAELRPVAQQSKRELPGTDSNNPADDDQQSNPRPLTKAERKRLRRMQQQNKAA